MATIYLLCDGTKISSQLQCHHTLQGDYIFPVKIHMHIHSFDKEKCTCPALEKDLTRYGQQLASQVTHVVFQVQLTMADTGAKHGGNCVA